MNNAEWKSLDDLELNIGQRPYAFNESSGFDASVDFSLMNSEMNGELLKLLEIDSESIKNELDDDQITSDGILLYYVLQKIIEFDLFEHEGNNNFMGIMREIVANISGGYAIFKNITCYDEADICTIKLEKSKASYFIEANPYYE